MLSRLLLQRVSSRAFAPNVGAAAGMRSVLVARQHLVRSFLTTAHVAEPVAKDSEGTKAKSKAKAATTKKATATKKAATKKTAVTKKAVGRPKATATKSKAKPKVSTDPKARLKAPLMRIKLTKEEKPPARGITAYSLFMREKYITGPKINNRDGFLARSREIGALWKQLSDEDKKPYYEKEKELREEYHKKFAEWEEKTEPRIVSAYKKQRRTARKERAQALHGDRPPKPTPPFIRFTMDVRKQIEVPTDVTHKEAISLQAKAVGEKWRALSDQEREHYKAQYREAMEAYKQEYPTA